jgi:hypothetical protein
MPKCNVEAVQLVKGKFQRYFTDKNGAQLREVHYNDCSKAFGGRGPTQMLCILTATGEGTEDRRFVVQFSDESCEVPTSILLLDH